ncbi:MAG TPA: DsrE family protein [Methanomassiliicoccales archaeon]|jgi:predicted peroxiredoxin
MEVLVIEIVHAPYGRVNSYAGLFIASSWVSAGHRVIVALHNDGVYAAKKGQTDPMKEVNMPSVEELVRDVLKGGGRVLADRMCLEVRGMDEDMLIEGVEISDGEDLVELVRKEGEGVLTF